MESITIYKAENGFIVEKNDISRTLMVSNVNVFEKVGDPYGSGLANYIREWECKVNSEHQTTETN